MSYWLEPGKVSVFYWLVSVFYWCDTSSTGPVFSYKLRYIVGFWLVEIAISTNQKPTIYRNLYENTAPGFCILLSCWLYCSRLYFDYCSLIVGLYWCHLGWTGGCCAGASVGPILLMSHWLYRRLLYSTDVALVVLAPNYSTDVALVVLASEFLTCATVLSWLFTDARDGISVYWIL